MGVTMFRVVSSCQLVFVLSFGLASSKFLCLLPLTTLAWREGGLGTVPR